jgi:uncharacterized protein (TIGR02145 family)
MRFASNLKLPRFLLALAIGTMLSACEKPFDPLDEFACGDTVTDIDGNDYKTVRIGSQCWFAENLRTARYRNGEPILSAWGINGQGAWIHYDNSPELGAIYGKLYNWYAAADARQVCPVGWHVPSHQEWHVLTDYLGENAGGKMKATGTARWLSPNTGATNESGFNGLPGGSYNYTRGFFSVGEQGIWWSSSQDQSAGEYAMMRYLSHNVSNVREFVASFHIGYSIRCIMD